MREELSRLGMLLGDEAVERLCASKVAVFGIGGVGGFCAEALVRSGVGTLLIVDHDRVSRSNLNRQILALQSTIGRLKVDVAGERFLDINPELALTARDAFYLPENAHEFDLEAFDFIIDAVDTVSAKIDLCVRAYQAGIPVISSMGAGNKLDPSRFRVSDLYETRIDPLARVMRRELRKRGVDALRVVWSDEEPMTPLAVPEENAPEAAVRRRAVPGSTAFVPACAGLIMAGEVIRTLAGTRKTDGTGRSR